jgi:hypothetical protein
VSGDVDMGEDYVAFIDGDRSSPTHPRARRAGHLRQRASKVLVENLLEKAYKQRKSP